MLSTVEKRDTIQQRIIHQALLDARGPLRPPEIVAAAAKLGTAVGRATVYRFLAAGLLAERAAIGSGTECDRRIREVWVPGQAPAYELKAKRQPHGHCLCRRCGRLACVTILPIEVKGEWGFYAEATSVCYHGLCEACHDQEFPKGGVRG